MYGGINVKVLFLSFYYAPDLSAGSFRASSLVAFLLEQGVKVDIVTSLPNRYASFSEVAPLNERSANMSIHRVAVPPHKNGMFDQVRSFSRFYRHARKLTKNEEYDMVFATSSRLFTAFLGARIAKEKGLPLYLDVRDIFADTIKDVFHSKLGCFINPILSKVEQYTFSNADRINLVSEGFKEYFTERFPKSSYRFFTNGIDGEFLHADFSPAEDSSNLVLEQSSEPLKVVYAGNIGEGQGLHRIVPRLASALNRSIKFIVIGDGGQKQQLISASVDNINIELLPPVKRSELINIYKSANVLFLHLNDYPAFEKVLPSKIFEYAALGKPIWAGVTGYAAKFLNEEVENVAVFPPGDVEQAISALESLDLKPIDRVSFKEKFGRDVIMKKMALDVISVGNML